MKIKIVLLCFLLSVKSVYAEDANLDLMSIIDLYKEVEAINYDYEELQKAYEEAKAREQSLSNRILTAATVAATGVGGMELAQGLAEQKADKVAEQDMNAYIATMRCEYGNGKSVKNGMTEIELPGGNDAELINLRNEYFALAQSVKQTKSAMGLKPGIESETVLDKVAMALYDNKSTGTTDGAYGSLYRAKTGNETDAQKINAEKELSQKRVSDGAAAAGGGTLSGIVGNWLINGKTDN